MTMVSAMMTGRCDALLEGLRAEFGAIQAERIIEAEAADFLWEARVQERYLGQHFDLELEADEASEDISRVAFLSVLSGRWYVGICVVDGEGMAVDLLWQRRFRSCEEARAEFLKAR